MSDKKTSESVYQYSQRLPLIPKELHNKFKIHCVAKGITMQSGAIEAIEMYVKEGTEKTKEE